MGPDECTMISHLLTAAFTRRRAKRQPGFKGHRVTLLSWLGWTTTGGRMLLFGDL